MSLEAKIHRLLPSITNMILSKISYRLRENAERLLKRRPEFFDRFQGRNDLLDYAAAKGIPVTSTKAKPYSMDDNIAHCSYEAGMLEDPALPAPDDMWTRTLDPRRAPDSALDIVIKFEKGLPVRLVVGKTAYTDSLELFSALNDIGKEAGSSFHEQSLV